MAIRKGSIYISQDESDALERLARELGILHPRARTVVGSVNGLVQRIAQAASTKPEQARSLMAQLLTH